MEVVQQSSAPSLLLLLARGKRKGMVCSCPLGFYLSIQMVVMGSTGTDTDMHTERSRDGGRDREKLGRSDGSHAKALL